MWGDGIRGSRAGAHARPAVPPPPHPAADATAAANAAAQGVFISKLLKAHREKLERSAGRGQGMGERAAWLVSPGAGRG